MALTPFSYDMEIIADLPDNPVTDAGLTPLQFKQKFDEGGLAIKSYINSEIVPKASTIGHTHELSSITDYEIDATPTDDSQNPVMSGGVFDALATKENTLDSKQKRSIYISSTEPTGQWQDGDIWLKTVE